MRQEDWVSSNTSNTQAAGRNAGKERRDLSESKRIEAIRMGAKEVTAREIVRIQQAKHQAQNAEEQTP